MHALDNIGFDNFKAFRERQDASVSTVSLFFGYNNSGKSSILRAVKFLSDSFKAKHTNFFTESVLDYSSSSMRGASHRELEHIVGHGLGFSLGWGDTSLSFKLKQGGIDPEIVEELVVTLDGKEHHFLPSLGEDSSANAFALKGNDEDELFIHGMRLVSDKYDFSPINELLDSFSESVFHLNSTRAFPPREFSVGIGVPLEISPDGSGTAELIWHLASIDSPSFKDINDWLEQISGRVISVDGPSLSAGNGKRMVRLETVGSKMTPGDGGARRVSVLDSGEGIAQVLPVITLCAQAANGELGDFPIVTIEQPELHLHPDATVALAEFICNCAHKNKNARFIIETHSESFLLSLQKALVEKKLLNEDFSCNWVSKNGSSSLISKVSFDDDGYILENWPENVFGEIFAQTRSLIDAREKSAS
ncbi:DUF3696 domain-containing protein [Corallincola luteus]|uniref:DUF3696 domain-containing protein n=1 Tax=Corallincola luteus TaxID=1775177 RepID=A0ABY2AMA6_9GAMM|nr:ATP-binding protein [Corallincola luteus]TCI04091.1 DUF3696 domain-containing protein [Corallincola luteus]